MEDFTHTNIQLVYNKQIQSQKCKILQYDLSNNLIKEWDSAQQAEKDGGFSHSKISLCCNGKNKTHKGYIWKFPDDLDLPNEIWKELDGDLIGLFISNMGRYYSKKMKKTYGKEKIQYNDPEGVVKRYRFHNLVLTNFDSERPAKNFTARHLNGDINDNRLENLKWEQLGKNKKTNQIQCSKALSKKIEQIENGEVINTYDSLTDAMEKTGITSISDYLSGKTSNAGGYQWEYIDECDLEHEEWKAHPTIDDLTCSNKGRILTKYNKKTYGRDDGRNGYLRYNSKSVHILIAQVFIENPEKKPTVDHIDGDKKNNCVENLRWATHKEQYLNRGHNL
jgi:hypothetical protein